MLIRFAKKIFGSANERYVNKLRKTLSEINSFESALEKLSDADLKAKTEEFKQRLSGGETLEDILPEAFAAVREASRRVLGMRHFDVQMLGGIVLHKGKISEMKTGEGKTLVATLPMYLNALTGKGAHLVTVNDYLAKRDSEWMGQIYEFLGLSFGCILSGMEDDERRAAYAADITYGTNHEFGFDYLRDHLRMSAEELIQRPFNYAIVDEVDSILIDEARTPLIISGAAEDSSEIYLKVDSIIPKLSKEDYDLDEKTRQVNLTESGNQKIEDLLKHAGLIEGSLYDAANISFVHHVNQALRAHKLFAKDVDYIIKDGGVAIVDEFTGRVLDGRRFGEGLHQAIEAKERVKIQSENQTIASTSYQNYFRLYPKLAGMTGTAMTEAEELLTIYGLDVVEIPTNTACIRRDFDDEVYRTAEEKYDAIIKEIEKRHKEGQPILIGTTSIEKSELLAEKLKRKTKLKFEILNARNHEREAYIIAQAGAPGAITVSTNMAGRGTDIQLGGNKDMRLKELLQDVTDPKKIKEITAKVEKEIQEGKEKVIKAGGLYVIGTERHESRRIDNQLRGRSGRQGDPGASKFFVSLQDDLMRIFGSERMEGLLQKMGLKEGEAIIHPWVSSALKKAQMKVEARHFDARKWILKFDDVVNDQRKLIYAQRQDILTLPSVADIVSEMRRDAAANFVQSFYYDGFDSWDVEKIKNDLYRTFVVQLPVGEYQQKELPFEQVVENVFQGMVDERGRKAGMVGEDPINQLEKWVLITQLDHFWREHLQMLDYLRHTISFRQYGQKDPVNEFKKDSFMLFKDMLVNLKERVVKDLSHIDVSTKPPEKKEKIAKDSQADQPFGKKVSRNEPCPCGSGKKYKHCHGAAV